MAGHYRVEEVRPTPRGWKVRTVKSGSHLVRVAFPPGPRQEGSGMVVEVLHPRAENPCLSNPAELVLIGGNPLPNSAGPYDRLSRDEKLAFGRLGLGKAQLRTEADIQKARREVGRVTRFRNTLPNPSEGTAEARELAAEFKHAPSDTYFVMDEPHLPGGDYARLGEFKMLAIKPEKGGQVQELSLGTKTVLLDRPPDGTNLHPSTRASSGHCLAIAGAAELEQYEIEIFTSSGADPVHLGEARAIVYRAVKWHPQIEDAYRGKSLDYEHQFGEEGGRKPEIWYSLAMRRLLFRGGDYTVEGVGIKN